MLQVGVFAKNMSLKMLQELVVFLAKCRIIV